MENNHLNRYFPIQRQDNEEILEAQDHIRTCAHTLADRINGFLPESPTKTEFLMRLMHLMRDVEFALNLDGVSRTKNMIVMQ